jgi:uncharacterized membrane protein
VRRSVLAAVVVLALSFVSAAAAKQTSITISTPSRAPVANASWPVTAHVLLKGKPFPGRTYRPTVYLLGKSGAIAGAFHGVRVGNGVYRIDIVFPHSGRWRYSIPDPIDGDWYFFSPVVRSG